MMDKVSSSTAIVFSRETTMNGEETLVEESVQTKVIEQLENQKSSKEQVENVIERMNQLIDVSRTHVKFEFHEKLEDYYVTVVDSKTNDVIKEIPSRKLLDMYASMLEFMGILVDKKI
ncbi:MAG: flagellar protein FlaG [Bacillus sp. (in: firmicutes)]